jgi:putative transposase
MLTGRRYRVEFTPGQAEFAEEIGGICRSVWNIGLEQRRAYRQRGAGISYPEQARQMAEAKKDFPWLAEAPSHVLQQTLMDLDRACRTHGTGKIRWRSQRRWSPSFRFPDPKQIQMSTLNRKWSRIKLPKLGWVTYRSTRPLDGRIRSVTVSRDGDRWFVSVLVEDGTTTPERHPSASSVGLDPGVVVAVATSDRELHDRPFTTPGEATRARRLQQRLARQAKTSRNRAKTRRRYARLRRRERLRRVDFGCQTAAYLTRRHGLVAIEKPNIGNMTRSATGTVEEPGRNVRQKTGLNRAILSKGWGVFVAAVESAARRTGTLVVRTTAAFSSQRCSRCQHVSPGNRESQAVFRCLACGFGEHADVNAAINHNAAGRKEAGWPHAVSACGDLGISRSVKQEPVRTIRWAHQLP